MDPTHSIRITCTLLGTPLFPAYINLMFLAFVARLYWLVSAVARAFIQSSRIPHSCCCLSSRNRPLIYRLKTTTIPAQRFCTSAPCLPVSTHACPTDTISDYPRHPCLPAYDHWTVTVSPWFIINLHSVLELGLVIGSYYTLALNVQDKRFNLEILKKTKTFLIRFSPVF